jgi:exoenzyme U
MKRLRRNPNPDAEAAAGGSSAVATGTEASAAPPQTGLRRLAQLPTRANTANANADSELVNKGVIGRPRHRNYQTWHAAAQPVDLSRFGDDELIRELFPLQKEFHEFMSHINDIVTDAKNNPRFPRSKNWESFLAYHSIFYTDLNFSKDPRMILLRATGNDLDPDHTFLKPAEIYMDAMRDRLVALEDRLSRVVLRDKITKELKPAATEYYTKGLRIPGTNRHINASFKKRITYALHDWARMEIPTSALGRWSRFMTVGVLPFITNYALPTLNTQPEWLTLISMSPKALSGMHKAPAALLEETSDWADAATYYFENPWIWQIPLMLWFGTAMLPQILHMAHPDSEKITAFAQWSANAQTPGNHWYLPLLGITGALSLAGYAYAAGLHYQPVAWIENGLFPSRRQITGGRLEVDHVEGSSNTRERDMREMGLMFQQIVKLGSGLKLMTEKPDFSGSNFETKALRFAKRLDEIGDYIQFIVPEQIQLVEKLYPILEAALSKGEFQPVPRYDRSISNTAVKMIYTGTLVVGLIAAAAATAAAAKSNPALLVDLSAYYSVFFLQTFLKMRGSALPQEIIRDLLNVMGPSIVGIPINAAEFIYSLASKSKTGLLNLDRQPPETTSSSSGTPSATSVSSTETSVQTTSSTATTTTGYVSTTASSSSAASVPLVSAEASILASVASAGASAQASLPFSEAESVIASLRTQEASELASLQSAAIGTPATVPAGVTSAAVTQRAVPTAQPSRRSPMEDVDDIPTPTLTLTEESSRTSSVASQVTEMMAQPGIKKYLEQLAQEENNKMSRPFIEGFITVALETQQKVEDFEKERALSGGKQNEADDAAATPAAAQGTAPMKSTDEILADVYKMVDETIAQSAPSPIQTPGIDTGDARVHARDFRRVVDLDMGALPISARAENVTAGNSATIGYDGTGSIPLAHTVAWSTALLYAVVAYPYVHKVSAGMIYSVFRILAQQRPALQDLEANWDPAQGRKTAKRLLSLGLGIIRQGEKAIEPQAPKDEVKPPHYWVDPTGRSGPPSSGSAAEPVSADIQIAVKDGNYVIAYNGLNHLVPISTRFPTAAKLNDGSSLYLREAPDIVELALSGGGGKGAVYPGLVDALGAEGLEKIKYIAGASVGAIGALTLACGATPAEFKEFANDTNLRKIIGADSSVPSPVPVFSKGKKLETMLRADNVEKFIKRRIEEKFSITLPNNGGPVVSPSNGVRPEQAEAMNIWRKIKTSGKTTFGDLRNLHKVVPAIKELTVTVTLRKKRVGGSLKKLDPPEPVILSADTEPDVDVVKAVHASASLPGLFLPVGLRLPKAGFKGVFDDGGILRNTPSSDVLGTDRKLDPIATTGKLAVLLDSEDARNLADYGEYVPRNQALYDHVLFRGLTNGIRHSGAEANMYRILVRQLDQVLTLSLRVPSTRLDLIGSAGTLRLDWTKRDRPAARHNLQEQSYADSKQYLDQRAQKKEFYHFRGVPDDGGVSREAEEEMLNALPDEELTVFAGRDGSSRGVNAKAAAVSSFRGAASALMANEDPQKTPAQLLRELDDLAGGDIYRICWLGRKLNTTEALRTLLTSPLEGEEAAPISSYRAGLAVAEILDVRDRAQRILFKVVEHKAVKAAAHNRATVSLLEQALREFDAARTHDDVDQALRDLANGIERSDRGLASELRSYLSASKGAATSGAVTEVATTEVAETGVAATDVATTSGNDA